MGKSKVVHWEITLADKATANRVKTFFGDIFSWKIVSDPKFDYGLVAADDSGIGGGIGPAGPGDKGHVTFYIGVDDVAACLKRIEAAGGKTVMPATEVVPGTTIGLFTDPAGNLVGLSKN